MKKTFYITSPIFYPNAKLHLGHAYVMTVCDIVARYHRLIGDKTYFLTGSDENTSKVIKAAAEQGRDVKDYLDEIVKSFGELYKALNISYDQFIRTTDKKVHWPGAIQMWNKLVEAGDIYKSTYTGLYCVSCEDILYRKRFDRRQMPDSYDCA
jgi:methionyl-tRNA synthetase